MTAGGLSHGNNSGSPGINGVFYHLLRDGIPFFLQNPLVFLEVGDQPVFFEPLLQHSPHKKVQDIEIRTVWGRAVIRDEGGKDRGQVGLHGLRGVAGGLILVKYGCFYIQTVGQIFSHELHTFFLVCVLVQLKS